MNERMSDLVLTHPKRVARLGFEQVSSSAQPTLRTLTDDIAAATGKPIDVRELPGLGRWGAAALWLELEDRHLILESLPTSAYHKQWVRLHEFGHIVFAHLGWADAPSHAQQDHNARAASLVEAAHTHRMSLQIPTEQAAEEFARYADMMIRQSAGGSLDSDFSVVLS